MLENKTGTESAYLKSMKCRIGHKIWSYSAGIKACCSAGRSMAKDVESYFKKGKIIFLPFLYLCANNSLNYPDAGKN